MTTATQPKPRSLIFTPEQVRAYMVPGSWERNDWVFVADVEKAAKPGVVREFEKKGKTET